MAANIAADLSVILPGVRVDPLVRAEPETFFEREDTLPRLLAPRVWGRLTPALRGDPRALEVRYVFDASEFGILARRLGWAERAAAPPAARPERTLSTGVDS